MARHRIHRDRRLVAIALRPEPTQFAASRAIGLLGGLFVIGVWLLAL
jgi:hypothetical protein